MDLQERVTAVCSTCDSSTATLNELFELLLENRIAARLRLEADNTPFEIFAYETASREAVIVRKGEGVAFVVEQIPYVGFKL
jgi:hypothetical protein